MTRLSSLRALWTLLFSLAICVQVHASESRAGTIGLIGSMGLYTYGMDDANARFSNEDNSKFDGGLGYGVGAKLYLSDSFAAKAAIDYLFASKASTRRVLGVDYNTRVDLPATLLFLGGEVNLLPGQPINLKLIAGYTLVSIYDGKEKGSDGDRLDLGAISGSGSGFQVGAGIEVFLGRNLSLGADLCFNRARIDGATFAGSPVDPGGSGSHGAVDYSGMSAKLALTVYLGGGR